MLSFPFSLSIVLHHSLLEFLCQGHEYYIKFKYIIKKDNEITMTLFFFDPESFEYSGVVVLRNL